jgi:hypothetical protein
MRGEQAVAEELAKPALAAAGYAIFHDIPGPDNKFNVDHLVVGTGGIFVIETKTRSKRKARIEQPEHEVRVFAQRLQFPWCYDDAAIPQAKAIADWIEDFIAPFCIDKVRVIPIVAVPGWSVQSDPTSAVKVMNASNVPKYIAACGQHYSGPELRGIVARFEERCRTLEF